MVTADAEGNFRVFYDYADSEYKSRMSFLLAEDGRELIPRHRLSFTALQAFNIPAEGDSIFYGRRPAGDSQSEKMEVILVPEGDRKMLALKSGNPPRTAAAGPDGGPLRIPGGPAPGPGPVPPAAPPQLLPFAPPGLEEIEDYLFTPEHIAIVSAHFANENSAPDAIIFRGCGRAEGSPAGTVTLSNISCIYSRPIVSRPVWAEGRFWVAWVRQRGAGEQTTWTTVLTGLNPDSGLAEHHDLPGLSHWNTTVGLAANPRGVLCAVWAASVDRSYRGQARIVTAVFPINPPEPD